MLQQIAKQAAVHIKSATADGQKGLVKHIPKGTVVSMEAGSDECLLTQMLRMGSIQYTLTSQYSDTFVLLISM